MNLTIGLSIYIFIFSFAVSTIAVKFFRWFSHKVDIVDHPGERKLHAWPTPLLGGAGVFVAFFATLILHCLAIETPIGRDIIGQIAPKFLKGALDSIITNRKTIMVLFSGAVLMFLLGLVDDKRGLSPKIRLLGEASIAAGVVLMGIRPGISDVFSILGFIVAVGWIVGITNGFNLMDGINGLCSGNAIISAGILAMVSYRGNETLTFLLLIAFVGSLFGFFLFNFPGGKVFLGSSGSMFIGYVLSITVFLQSYGAAFGRGNPLPLVMPILILSLPLVDTLSVMYLRFKRHQPLFRADHSHLHHRLIRLRYTNIETVGIILALSFAVGVNSTLLSRLTMSDSIIVLLQAVIIFVVFISLIHVRERRVNRRGDAAGYLYIHATDMDKQVTHQGLLVNISPTGASFSINNVQPGECQIPKRVDLRIFTAESCADKSVPYIDVPATIAWQKPVGPRSLRLGVSFVGPLEIDQAKVEDLFYIR